MYCVVCCRRGVDMAGVAESSQVVSSDKSVVFDGELSPTDLTFNLSGADSASLQELIDSELALRIGGAGTVLDVDAESSERLLEAERTHTTATLNTLNIFSDTIDLSPDCEPVSPLFPHTPIEVSPQLENKSFDASDLEVSEAYKPPVVDSDESPITEDASDLEPIPLFTQTITSDHEQSPLTEVNPFLADDTETPPVMEVEVGDEESPSVVKSPPIDEVLVVIEPPDDSTPNSNDSPERVISPQGILIEEMEAVEKRSELYEDEPLVAIEFETKIDSEIKTESEIVNESASDPDILITELPSEPSEFQACLVDSVDASDNSMQREFVGVVVNPVVEDSEWTTVEEATKLVESEEVSQEFEPKTIQHSEDFSALHVSH